MGKRTGRPVGRPPGSKSALTIAKAAAMPSKIKAIEKVLARTGDVFHGDAHALLISVYKDAALDMTMRLDAAKAAIRFETPGLQSTTHGEDKDNPFGGHNIITGVPDRSDDDQVRQTNH